MSGLNADKLLSKITHYDKDERYMCLSDICVALNSMPQSSRLEPSNETKLLKGLLGVLDKDTVVDVQAIAVRTLSLLVTKISESAVSDLCDKLSSQVLQGSKEMRDVYAVGLKTILLEVPNTPQMATSVLKAILPKMLSQGLKDTSSSSSSSSSSSLSSTGRSDVRSEFLEIALDLVKRFGYAFQVQDANDLMIATVECVLDKTQVNIRRRATSTLGALSLHLNDSQLDQLVGTLLGHIDADQKRKAASMVEDDLSNTGGNESPRSPSLSAAGGWIQRTMVQTIGAISRQVGQRLGRFIERIVPLFLSVLGSTPAEAGAADESGNTAVQATELRENILAAFESLFGPQGQLSSSSLTTRGIPTSSSSSSSSSSAAASTLITKRAEVLRSCVAWASFDPNYNYGDEETMEEDVSMMAAGNESNDGEMDGDDDYDMGGGGGDDGDTDDDVSWKVRKAAVRVLTAVVSSCNETGSGRENLHDQIYPLIGRTIVHRFIERQESVRLEVIACAEALLLASHSASTVSPNEDTFSSSSTLSSSSLGAPTDMEALLASGTIGRGAFHVPASLSASASSSQIQHTTATQAISSSSSSDLNSFVRILIPATARLLKPSSDTIHNSKTRIAILKLVRSLALVVDCESFPISGPRLGSGSAATLFLPALPVLLPAIFACLKDKSSQGSSQLKIEACHLLHTILLVFSSTPSSLAPFIPILADKVTECCSDDYFRIVSVSLRSTATLTTLLFPANGASSTLSPTLTSAVISKLLSSVMARLASPNVDQEIKEGAITAAGVLLAHASTETAVKSQINEIFRLFCSRLASENTRLQVLRSLAYAGAAHSLVPGLAETFVQILPELAGFLKQSARPLRAQTLATVNSLFTRLGSLNSSSTNSTSASSSSSTSNSLSDLLRNPSSSSFSSSSASEKSGYEGLRLLIVEASSSLNLSERDLYLTHLVLELLVSVISVCSPTDASSILLSTSAFSKTIELSRSPLVQGVALSSLCSVVRVACSLSTTDQEFSSPAIVGDIVGTVKNETTDSHGGMNSIQSSARAISTAISTSAKTITKGFEAYITVFVDDATSGKGGLLSRKVVNTEIGGKTSSTDTINGAGAKKISLPLLSRFVISECARFFDIYSIKPSYLSDFINSVLTDKTLYASAAASSASGAGSGAGSAAEEMRTAAALAVGGIVASAAGGGGGIMNALSLLLNAAEICLNEAHFAVEANKAERAEVERLRKEADKDITLNANIRDPVLISNFITSTKPYAILQAVREVILRHSPCSPSGPVLPESAISAFLALLTKPTVCGIDEEGVRNIVAECFGKLAIASPVSVLHIVRGMTQSSNHLIRWTAASMMRFCLLSSSSVGVEASSLILLPSIENELSNSLVELLACLGDKNETVRLAGVTALNTLIHGAPHILFPLFKKVELTRFPIPTGKPVPVSVSSPGILSASPLGASKGSSSAIVSASPVKEEIPTFVLIDDGDMWTPPAWPSEGILACLLYESLARTSLIREVELGPFKHVIDDNVSTRKASFASLESIIERFPLHLLGPEILLLLCAGMRDTAPTVLDSARILAHSAFHRACSRGMPALSRLLGASSPTTSRALLDTLAGAIELSVMKVSEKSSEGELDLARSALRSLYALKKVMPEAQLLSSKLASLSAAVLSDSRLSRLSASVSQSGEMK
jgi:hypothetical protein